MKKFIPLTIVTTSLAILLGLFLLSLLEKSNPIVFESLESKTEHNKPVYNRIQFLPGKKTDVWLMQQSHHGLNKHYTSWDRLAIAVDKTTKPYRAKFYQLAPGELGLDPESAIPYSARCYACHANGPRAVRPAKAYMSKLSLKEKLRIQLWNLRIKTYGTVHSEAGTNFKEGVPFKAALKGFDTPLALKSCDGCHSEGGIRNVLRVEHISTVGFLVNQGIMPPFPWKISEEDKRYLAMILAQ